MSVKITLIVLLLTVFYLIDTTKVRHHSGSKQALKYIGYGYGNGGQLPENSGLWPSVFNVATKALISVNATCGEEGREEFCRISDGARGKCGVCDNFSNDSGKRHSILYAIDSSHRWWQSPSLYYGPEYEYITITIDLKQVYQIAYAIIKAANSPRPGAWILERSLDGEYYKPWQYFARYDKECMERYGIPATKGKPYYVTDSDVICTSDYSKLNPTENGEIHISLIHGRPGANETSPELLEFTKARYVRLRLQGFRATVEPIPRWLLQDISKDKRLFYSIRDISIGGQCVCNGHAAHCRHNVASGHPECECAHHTCGANCEKCCPLFNQAKWGPGSSRNSRECIPCNCHGHAMSCHYDEAIDRAGLSLDINENRQGGGVCDNCTVHTTGINCEKCVRGYYRLPGILPDAEVPCIKCECDRFGSTGVCDQDGLTAGRCNCKPGYAGSTCNQCASGYRGYPNCEICPCDMRGVVPHNNCENDCTCKSVVDGKNCDHCKTGYFALRSDNPEGCSACYCSGVTTLCESAILIPRQYQVQENWRISDISASTIVNPTWDPEANSWLIGNFEIPDVEAFYWLAPKDYLGNKLESYGSHLIFKVQWIVMRGDTSGKPTLGPNIILIGNNGMKIAYGDDEYTGSNATFQMKLHEYGWYHIPSDVKDIITRLRRTEYKGDPVSRFQFLNVLTSIKYIMLRATFHTDQIEAMLEGAVLESGELGEDESYSSVEKCSCPSGYTGLSCESCDYGYVKIVTNTTTHQEQGFCVKCDCNGHSETCNPDTGQCFCEHNTTGEKCERCLAGFYGNPLLGAPTDCKKCACPLIEEQNNFSPSCQLDYFPEDEEGEEEEGDEEFEPNSYVCTQCPKGYTGDHCELCDDGYFGDPTELNSRCEPCSCAGGRCDRTTGQCLGCPGNTEGWRCEKCKIGYFGDPLTANCQVCLCDPVGSASATCNNVTGQCECKSNFVGRTCNQCEDGFGNVTAGCTQCTCSKLGSMSEICDPHTGMCDCKPGVEGFHCDACQHLHYGFSEIGCNSCNCNIRGSEISTCDITTGQCRCKPYYEGRTCDKCQDGYWEKGSECVKCDCDPDGTKSTICDQKTGQCECKSGIGGITCNKCLPGYYGFSSSGCKACDPCDKKGHICDADTGRCICPPYSHGAYCHICSANTWGYEPEKGCKTCNCSRTGSLSMQCNLNTGECNCRLGYIGFNCNRCSHGYFGYPRCRRCNCNYAGTDKYKARCDADGVCQCSEEGYCPCKTNLSGRKCDSCKDGTFGLHLENPDGCTQCFCFGRSTKCSESGLTWSQLRINSSRTLSVQPNFASEFQGAVREIEISDKLLIIPDVYGNVSVHRYHFDSPLYWKIHPIFNGDRVLSYGGYLSFISHTINSRQRLQQDVINHYPLVQLRGHGKIILEYYPPLPSKSNRHEVRLHESLWKRIYPKDTHLSPRELLMITLQNVQNIYIKATDSSDFESLVLQDVVLDTAIEVPGAPPPLAKGVEVCDCPRQYNSSSCQDPSIGFYRDYTPFSVNGTILIDTFIGTVKPCECNGRSRFCDIETGYCLNCKANTDGRYCEKCAEGFYGNPMLPFGICEPCPCPTPEQNFAKECWPLNKQNQFMCKCKEGYTGAKCDKCSFGYYGQPQTPGGSCQPCNCNNEGKASDECDSETGQCNCKPGIIGKQCSQCEKPRHVLQKFECTPCDKCTQWLLDDIDLLSNEFHSQTYFLQNGTVQPPWIKLKKLEFRYGNLNDKLALHIQNRDLAEKIIKNNSLDELQERLNNIKDNLKSKNPDEILNNGKALVGNSEQIIKELRDSNIKLQELIKTLQNFGKSQLSVRDAVKQAKDLMRQINLIDQNMRYSHEEVLNKCKHVKTLLQDMISNSTINPKDLQNELFDLNKRIEDLETIAVATEIKTNEAELVNRGNEIRFVKLSEKLHDINEKNKSLNENLLTVLKSLNETYKIFNSTAESFATLSSDVELQGLIEKLKNRNEELSQIDTDEYLDAILKHVHELEWNATEYEKLFNLSSKEIDALKASEAYANIKKFIDEADELASQALAEVNSALDTLSPEGKDSIATNTSISLADSERLEIRIKHQRDNLAALKKRKANLALQLKILEDNNWNNGLKNRDHDNNITVLKNRLNNGNEEKMKDLIKDAINQTDRIKSIHREVMNLGILKQTEIMKPFEQLQNLLTTEELNKLQSQINITKDTLQSILKQNHTYMDIIKQNTNKYDQFKNTNDSISKRLSELKAQIDKVKKKADRIRISLTGPTCRRSYLLHNLSPTLSTKLTISFNYSTNGSPNIVHSLFYLGTATNQFINLTLAQNILQFEWKLEDKINKLEYPDALVLNTYYSVDIERTGNYAEITVNNNKISKIYESDNETAIFNAEPTDLVYIGPGLAGCIRDIVYNDFKIGLWNFHTTSGQCLGCIRNNDQALENAYDFYKGDGYAFISKKHQALSASPEKFNVQFSLRTFDENALLFLAPDEERKNYIAVYLKDGYIQYEIHYVNHKDIILKSKKRYNNGEKVRVSAEKHWNKNIKQDTAVLKVNEETEPLTEIRENIDSSAVLRLKKVNYYFGGVSPEYFLNQYMASKNLHTHDSLLGGLDELKEYLPFNDDTIQKFGVGSISGELEFRQAWFEGNGYVNLKAQKVQNKILFVIRTKESNCFLMYINNSTLFAINNGKLHVKLNNNKNVLYSNTTINDNKYHLIELSKTKKNNKVTTLLKVNGLVQGALKSEEKENNAVDDTIYIGGAKHINEAQNLFSGVISDIIIDNELIKFNKSTLINFENVKIGRTGPQREIKVTKVTTIITKVNGHIKTSTEITDVNPSNIKEMQNTESCGQSPNYTFDPNAAKFGDKLHSHVLHYLKDNFWRKDYTLELEFRTLQPNGLLFLSYGPKQHFNLLEVKNGKLVFRANGKKLREVGLPQKVDDGSWYSVKVETLGLKKKRKLTVSINGFTTKPIRPPRNKVLRELYIGGVSQNTTTPNIIRFSLHSFKGCIRGLKINKKSQTLVRDKNTVHHNIGQCFPHIEKGSYFGGDAYAIYNNLFHIDQTLELSLEFRTSEQNGILISVSNPRNSPALAVELQNGAIVMTTDNGYGTITNVTNNLSDFALCNNQWHNITAVYTSTEITINVDGIRKIWVQPDDETLMDELEAPLYVGGLPDYAPVGTLKMKENFKGCMKNVKIGDNFIDWLNMEKLSNILLDSCPTLQ